MLLCLLYCIVIPYNQYMLRLEISDTPTPQHIDMLAQILQGGSESIDYPEHEGWIEKAIENIRLSLGKVAIVAHYNSTPLGCIVFQPHPDLPGTAEIRNLTLTPELIRQQLPAIPHILLQTLDHAVRDAYPSTKTMVADTKASNKRVIGWATQNGWDEAGTTVLASGNFQHNGKPDTVLVKQLGARRPTAQTRRTLSGLILPR